MPAPATKTYMAKTGEIEPAWHLVDADGQVLGRLATRIATILMGKHRPEYTPHIPMGDCVVVLNAAKIKLTGNKANTKEYQKYSYYPGGQKIIPISQWLEKHPDRVILTAVRRMLPKNKLGRVMLKRLRVFPGPEHTHQAQNPQPLDI